MQATRKSDWDWEDWLRVRTSWATVSAVSRSYQNWLSLQSSVTKATSFSFSSGSALTGGPFCSARNSFRAAKVSELSVGVSSSSSSTTTPFWELVMGLFFSSSSILLRLWESNSWRHGEAPIKALWWRRGNFFDLRSL